MLQDKRKTLNVIDFGRKGDAWKHVYDEHRFQATHLLGLRSERGVCQDAGKLVKMIVLWLNCVERRREKLT